jgi:anti-sigma B factor antagonist
MRGDLVKRDACRSTVSPLVVPEIVSLPVEIDLTNATQAGDELCAAFGPGVAVVIADMSRTAFCGSAGIRQLLLAHDRAVAGEAELRVVAAPAVRRVLQVTGFDEILSIYPDLQAALTNAAAQAHETRSGSDGASSEHDQASA